MPAPRPAICAPEPAGDHRSAGWLALAVLIVPLVAGIAGVGSGGRRRRPGSPAAVAVRFALAQLGKPYRWGADGPRSFDCSGLVQTAYRPPG
jgi:peptidoglycan DL-endopeptidase CwlO